MVPLRTDPNLVRATVTVGKKEWLRFKSQALLLGIGANERLGQALAQALEKGALSRRDVEEPLRIVIYVPRQTWRTFRARCIEQGVKTGEALTTVLKDATE